MGLPRQVTVIEVGPRDGLQNEPMPVPTETKIEFIRRLSETGLTHIEATSFVSPGKIPQLADAKDVYPAIPKESNIHYPVLVPNETGMHAAIEAGAKEIAIFTAASERFCQRNINCSIAESLQRFEPVMKLAHQHDITVRGYVSCAIACPFEGAIAPSEVLSLSNALRELGCYQVSLGDTIGVGTPGTVIPLLETVLAGFSCDELAVHFHDTYGQALANIYIALTYGISTLDAAVAGIGGCPYAPGASGNVATEDVVYMLNGLHIESGIDLPTLIDAGNYICHHLGRANQSRVAQAYQSKE